MRRGGGTSWAARRLRSVTLQLQSEAIDDWPELELDAVLLIGDICKSFDLTDDDVLYVLGSVAYSYRERLMEQRAEVITDEVDNDEDR